MTSLLLSCSTYCSPSMEKHTDFLSGSSLYSESPPLDYSVACIFKLIIFVFFADEKSISHWLLCRYQVMQCRIWCFSSWKFIMRCIIIWILLSELTVLQCFASTLMWYCQGGIRHPRSWRYLPLGNLDENLERSGLILRSTRIFSISDSAEKTLLICAIIHWKRWGIYDCICSWICNLEFRLYQAL